MTNDENEEETTTPADPRPMGSWLRIVDGLLTREFAAALDGEDLDRRDWMLLNAVSGDVHAPGLDERLARNGKRLRALEARGWIEQGGDGTWALSDLGREEKERIGEVVDGIRSRVVNAVGDEAFATTLASLEAIARELGWDDGDIDRHGFPAGPGFGGFGRPRPFRPEIRFGWGPNRHRGFEPGRPGHPGHPGTSNSTRHDAYDDGCRSHGWHGHHDGAHSAHEHHGHHDYGHGARWGLEDHGNHGHGHAHHGHAHHGHAHHGHAHHGHSRGRRAQQAYERGFDAGFARGQESGAA